VNGVFSSGLFSTYESKEDGHLVLAAKVERKNILELSKLLKVVFLQWTSSGEPFLEFLDEAGRTSDIAELGDYVLCDLAGHFKPADREIFEAKFQR